MAMAGIQPESSLTWCGLRLIPFEVAEQSGPGIDLFSEMLSSAEAQRLHCFPVVKNVLPAIAIAIDVQHSTVK